MILWVSFTSGFAQKVRVQPIDSILSRVNRHSDTTWVLNFWATWCKPCVAELWDFNNFHTHNQDKPIRVLLLSVDNQDAAFSRVEPFIQKRKISAEVLVVQETNPNLWMDKIDPKWSGSIPSTLFIAAKTQKRLFKEQSFDEIELNDTVFPMLSP